MRRLTRCFLGLCAGFLLLAAPAQTRAEEWTEEQALEAYHFVINNAIFIMFHEAGHMLVSEFNLPVLGREEDAVDALSSVLLLEADTEELDVAMQDAADGWFLTDDFRETDLDESDFFGTHGLDRQRAYQMVCMMTGHDPDYFDEFADSLDFPDDRREECAWEYQQTRESWFSLLAENMEEGAKTKMIVNYEPAGDPDLQFFADLLKQAEVLEMIETVFGTGYKLEDGIRLSGRACGEENAFWDPNEREIIYCYELLAYHAGLIDEWFKSQSEEAAADTDQASQIKTKLKSAATQAGEGK